MDEVARYLPAGERRALTVETVIQLAAERNPGDITISAIAARMGLTQAAVFRHFPTKEAVMQAVMSWVAEKLLSRVDVAIQSTASPSAALRAVFMTHVAFVVDHPGVPRIIFQELQRTTSKGPRKLVQMLRRYGERLLRLLHEGKRRGELIASLDVEAAAALFVGSIQGLVMQSLLAGDAASIHRLASRRAGDSHGSIG